MAYATAQNLYDRFGQTNVRGWADLEGSNSSTEIDSRINEALNSTANDIDSAIRSKYNSVPLQGMDTSTARQMMQINRDLAAYWLYFSRGQLGTEGVQDPKASAFNAIKKAADAQVLSIANGTMRIVAAAVWGSLNPRGPAVIT